MRRVTSAGGPVWPDPRVPVYEVTTEGLRVTHPRVGASLVVPLDDTRSVGELAREVGDVLVMRFPQTEGVAREIVRRRSAVASR